MDHGTLDHPLKPGRGLRLAVPRPADVRQLVVDEVGQIPRQLFQVDAAGPEHGNGIPVLRQRKQKMFQGRVFVVALGGQGQGPVQGLFEVA